MINSYAGNRVRQEGIDTNNQSRVKDLFIQYNMAEMAGQSVLIELFPSIDYIFYPDCIHPPLAELYKFLKSEQKLSPHKHLWVEIKFLSEAKALKKNSKLLESIQQAKKNLFSHSHITGGNKIMQKVPFSSNPHSLVNGDKMKNAYS